MEETRVPAYPVQFSVDYPERPLSRLSTLFRPILIIPIIIIAAFVAGQTSDANTTFLFAGGTLFVAPLLLILFRQKYPRWWFDWNVALLKFESRVTAYFLLLSPNPPKDSGRGVGELQGRYPGLHWGRWEVRRAVCRRFWGRRWRPAVAVMREMAR